MIIGHVVSCLTTGGAEKLVADMSKILKEKNIKVKVISILEQKGIPYNILKKNNIELVELNYKSKYDFRIAYDIYIETKVCDIVHTHTFYAQFYSIFFVNNNKLITTEHSTYNNRREMKLFKILDYIMYKKYKKIICISEATKKNLNSWIKSTQNKSVVINNGIELKRYMNSKAINKSFFGVSNNEYILTCVGSLTKQKNHKKLIDSMKFVNGNIKLFIIGDGILREELKKRVIDLKLEDKVIFLGNQNNIPGILKASDAFVLASIWEGFGLAAVEAAAVGIPLILSDVSGLNSLFNENKIYKINTNDEHNIAKIINKVYKTKKNDIKIVNTDELKKYSIEIMVDKYVDIYINMINKIKYSL